MRHHLDQISLRRAKDGAKNMRTKDRSQTMLEEGRSADLQRLWGWGRTVASATLQLVHSFSAWFCFPVVGG